MKKYGITISGFIFILLFVVAVSGCISADNSTKHYDNGNISFDYPASMSVKQENSSHPFNVNINNNQWTSGVQIAPRELNSRITLDSILSSYVNGTNPGQLIQFTINGKTAYNVTTKNQDGTTSYATMIDLGSSVLVVQPTTETKGAHNPTSTDSYKAYELVLRTLQINS